MMQSQGLGALMPQDAQQMAPQQPPMDPQRLAAATNLVSNDAERQVLDPRTLALIKYKDAVAAMQAADELMAASQPTPTPPTVAERVQQSAQEGIMGLASRLGAGIQQQGSNMQAEQMQQAMSGGLPQLPAPNMAGMAQGGIVGYQDGGDIESAELEQLTQQLIQEGVPPEEARNEARLRLRLPLPGLPRVPNLLPDPTAPARAAISGTAALGRTGAVDDEEVARQMAPYGTQPTPGADGSVERRLIQGSMSDEEIADLTQRRQPSAEGSTERLPSSTYGMGDRTGSIQLPDNLLGGAGNILRSPLPSASTGSSQPIQGSMSDEEIADFTQQRQPIQGSMSDEEIADFTQRRQPTPGAEGRVEQPSALDTLSPEMRAEVETILSGREPAPESARRGAYTGPTSAERRAETAKRTEGSLRRIEQQAERRRAESSLRQTLARAGLGKAEIDQMIAAQRLPEGELESAEFLPSEAQESFSGLPDALSAITQDAAQPRFLPEQSQSSAPDRGPVRQIPENELAQIEAEIESDPNAFERLASWVAENPYDAISMGLIAVPGIGLAGSLSMRIGGALMRSPAVRRAVQSLYTRPNPAVTRGPGFTMRDPNMPLRVGAPGRAISVGSGVAGTGMMLGRGGDGEGIASLPIGPTEETTRAEAPVTSAVGAQAADGSTAADAQAQAAAPAEVSQDAVETLLEQEQQPRAGESAADRDARMRRLIAGLRGFGAQGLGGFAAGSSAEELRQEQALTDEQERQRRAGMEDRELDLKDREITLMDQIRRGEAKDRRLNQVMSLAATFTTLDENVRGRLGQSIVAATDDVAERLSRVNQALANPRIRRRERKELTDAQNALRSELELTTERVTKSFGEGLDYRPIVESLLRSAMPAGTSGGGITAGSPVQIGRFGVERVDG